MTVMSLLILAVVEVIHVMLKVVVTYELLLFTFQGTIRRETRSTGMQALCSINFKFCLYASLYIFCFDECKDLLSYRL